MPALSPKQLSELGHHFLAFAQAVGNYRYTKKLSKLSNKVLSDMHWTLLNYSDDFYTASASIALSNVQKSLETIRNLTKEMNESYQHINNVQRAIDVAAAVITLGGALFSKSPQAVTDALDKLVVAWKG